MKRLVLCLMVAAPAAALACEGMPHETAAVKKLSVPELQKSAKAVVFDANTADFRAKNGTIPGAKLLTSATQYDVKELPSKKDEALVFYCASAMCSASQSAAQRAVQAGYTDVAVLTEGMKGWKAAGQKTVPVKPNS